jgi:hypothetical protein
VCLITDIQDSKDLIKRAILKTVSIDAYQGQGINFLIIDTIIGFLYFSLKNKRKIN